jgi:DNA-binding CsgD family transcriptional regulator
VSARTKPNNARGEAASKPKRSRTAPQLSRQEQVFKLRVIDRMTVRQVAEKLNISLETVLADERAELERRAEEIEERREVETAAHLALVDDLYRQAMSRKGTPGTGALGAAAKALEMRAKLLGLDAPTRVEVGVSQLIEALAIPDDPPTGL